MGSAGGGPGLAGGPWADFLTLICEAMRRLRSGALSGPAGSAVLVEGEACKRKWGPGGRAPFGRPGTQRCRPLSGSGLTGTCPRGVPGDACVTCMFLASNGFRSPTLIVSRAWSSASCVRGEAMFRLLIGSLIDVSLREGWQTGKGIGDCQIGGVN